MTDSRWDLAIVLLVSSTGFYPRRRSRHLKNIISNNWRGVLACVSPPIGHPLVVHPVGRDAGALLILKAYCRRVKHIE